MSLENNIRQLFYNLTLIGTDFNAVIGILLYAQPHENLYITRKVFLTMNNEIAVLGLSAIMGLSIFLSLPFVMGKKRSASSIRFMISIAVGILVFLIADVFSDSADIMYNNSLAGYGTNPVYDLIFGISLIVGFGMLYLAETRSKSSASPFMLSLFIAIGIGFQNLTEGLVFGASFDSIGLVGLTVVILIGFILQNFTEGFPIASPFLGNKVKSISPVIMLFLVGGVPTIVGGGVGYFYSSNMLDLAFNGLAIGAMFYVILPILRSLFKNSEQLSIKTVYAGAFIGFFIGFLVNLI